MVWEGFFEGDSFVWRHSGRFSRVFSICSRFSDLFKEMFHGFLHVLKVSGFLSAF